MKGQRDTKVQQLSLRESGEWDRRFHIAVGETGVTRRVTTAWQHVCLDRAKRGVSRKARIAAKRAAV